VPGKHRNWDSDTALNHNMPNFSLSHKRAEVAACGTHASIADGDSRSGPGFVSARP
jgi:hypothetical protein